MTPQDWEFIGVGVGWGFAISGVLLVLDGLYNLICWALYRKKKTSRRAGTPTGRNKHPRVLRAKAPNK